MKAERQRQTREQSRTYSKCCASYRAEDFFGKPWRPVVFVFQQRLRKRIAEGRKDGRIRETDWNWLSPLVDKLLEIDHVVLEWVGSFADSFAVWDNSGR